MVATGLTNQFIPTQASVFWCFPLTVCGIVFAGGEAHTLGIDRDSVMAATPRVLRLVADRQLIKESICEVFTG